MYQPSQTVIFLYLLMVNYCLYWRNSFYLNDNLDFKLQRNIYLQGLSKDRASTIAHIFELGVKVAKTL